MPQPNDLSRSLVTLDQNSTIIAVVELSHSSWLVGGVLPGIERQPRKKLEPSPERPLALLHRWRDEAVRAGRTITRIALAFEAGRDGFWLARWLAARGIEAHVIHCASCHGVMLEGGSAVPLSGATFEARWADEKHSVDDLFYIVRTLMPYGKPATLSKQEYIDIIAYLLMMNGHPAGAQALPLDPSVLGHNNKA